MPILKDNNGILEIPMDPKYAPDQIGFGAHCFKKMKEFSNNIAQIDSETNKSDTYGEILISSIRVALKMKSMGVTDTDIVSLCTGNHRHTCIPQWASIFMGVKLANLDPSIALSDMKHLTNLTKPKLIFSVPESVENLEVVIKELNLDIQIVVFGETNRHIPFTEFLKPQQEENEFKAKVAENLFDTVLIFYSSGTTGLPKGVCINHYGLLYTANIARDYCDFSAVLFYTSPYWISYMLMVSATLLSGGYRVLCKFDEKNFLKIIQDFKITNLFLPPSFTYGITAHPANNAENFDTSSLTTMCIGGSCIGKEQIEKIRNLFKNCSVCQGYGLTECTALFSLFNKNKHPELLISKTTSCGTMIPDTMCKVVDVDTNKILGPNKQGELLIKTNRLMNGYYKEPQRTAEVFDKDGFLHTGDVVYYDEDYCFYVVDRIKEMFKYKSWHIVPSELENILLKNPAVKEVLVIGYPNEEDGDHPMAVIVLNNDSNVTEKDIIQYFNDQVSDRKKLRGGVKFVSSLPRTTTGKYNRRTLRNMVINNGI